MARDEPVFRIYLLVGQSNMAGRGTVEDEDREAHPRVWALDRVAQWVPAREPLHFDKPTIAGVGPGLAFGKAVVARYPNDHVGLVPCAVGGSPIRTWVPGNYITLGTDGFGRSDTREALRRFYEVDAESIIVACLYALSRDGSIPAADVAEAIRILGLDPDKPDPLSV